MSRERTLSVSVATFINPTIFWVIDTCRISARDELEKELLECSSESADPVVGEPVAVKDGSSVKRAKVIEIDVESKRGRYFCWLIDYGVAIYANCVYNLPFKYKKIPDIALRASLLDVVYLETTFDVVNTKVVFVESTAATEGAVHTALKYIKQAIDMDFQVLKENDDICFGDLIILKDNKYVSLTNELVKEKILAKNEILFWQNVEELSPRSFASILKNVSKHSLINSNSIDVNVKYDDKAQTYVVMCPAKNLIEEFQSENTESVGRSCRLRSVKTPEQSNLQKTSKNVTSPGDQGVQSEVTVGKKEKSPKTPNTLSILKKLKASKANSSTSNEAINDKSSNNEDAENVNEVKDVQTESKNKEPAANVKIVEDSETKGQVTDSSKDYTNPPAIEIADSSSEISSVSHLNFMPAGCQLVTTKKSKTKKSATCSRTPSKLPRSTTSCTSETFSDTFKARKLSISPTKSSSSSSSPKETIPNETIIDSKNERTFSSSSSSSEDAVLNFSDPDKKLMGCTCDTCKFWDTVDVKHEIKHFHGNKFADSEVKTVKNLTKPPLLLKSGTEEDVEIKTLSTLPSSVALKGKKVKLAPLVVHGVVIPSPTETIQDAPFHESVHNCLSSFERAKKIQMFVWPAVMRNMNVCYVNGAESGKTMAYLPAIYSFLLDETRYSSFSTTLTGPFAVILCDGSKKAEAVYEMVLRMKAKMRGRNNCDAVLALLPISTTVTRLLLKKHSLLITTLPSLVILLNLRKVSLKRMCHLVFEDADILLEKYSKHFKSLLGLAHQILEHRTCSQTIQIILSSEQWTNPLREVACQLKLPPLICIGAYLEAAVYGNASIKMHFLESKRKQSTLVDILIDDQNCYNKCIVICSKEEELDEASFLFPNRSVKSIIIRSSLVETEIKAREQQWDSSTQGAYPVLLCTDHVFNMNLNVTDATLLVHYSLPTSWTLFSYRFSCFVDNYTCPFGSNNTNDVICKSFIFVDENCHLQFPRLVSFLERMNVALPNRFLQHCQMLKEQEEIDKINKNVRLCDTLKVLGSCADDKCKKRHLLSNEVDFAYKMDGYVTFEILNVRDVSTYTVRLLKFNRDGEIKKYCTDIKDIEEKLREALDTEKANAEEINVGTWFATLAADGKTWMRCEVLKVLDNGSVRIYYVDDGVRGTVPKSNLYKLPEKLGNIPAQATLVHFANMVPPENDLHYSRHAVLFLERILKNAEEKFGSKTYKGRVRLLLKGDILWLDSIVLTRSVKNYEVTLLYLRDKLLQNKLADYKENTLGGLFELCKKVDIPVPEYKVVENSAKREKIEPCYAFLEEDVSYSEVYFKAGNPSEFFVCLKKFQDLVQKLESDILKVVHKPFYKLEDDVVAGDHYLAFDAIDKKYCRVRVISVENNYAECFFVDYGDYQTVKLENLRKLPEKFMSKLPFQAIECRLFGISPVLDVWCKEATDILYEYCFEPDSDYYRTLYAVVCSKETAKVSCGKKYSILLLDNLSGRTISIGNLMIDCGFATLVEDEKLPEDLPVIENSLLQYSDDDDLEEQPNEVETFDEFEDELPSKWDMEIFNAFDLITGKHIDAAQILQQRTAKRHEIEPPPRALPLSEFRTPTVQWYQTDMHIKLDILLPDVTEYIAKVLRDRLFVFRTKQNGVPYHLSIQLYAKVEKTLVHSAGGQVVKVTLSKCRKEEWQRLTIQKDVKNVKYNMEMYREPETEESSPCKVLTLGKELDDELGLELDQDDEFLNVGSDFNESSNSDLVLSD